jgi:hypothetical protein
MSRNWEAAPTPLTPLASSFSRAVSTSLANQDRRLRLQHNEKKQVVYFIIPTIMFTPLSQLKYFSPRICDVSFFSGKCQWALSGLIFSLSLFCTYAYFTFHSLFPLVIPLYSFFNIFDLVSSSFSFFVPNAGEW